MSEPYDVPVELVKLYGSLERNWALIESKKIGEKDVLELAEILLNIDEYKSRIGNNTYMYKDMIDVDRLNKLEKYCKNLLGVAEKKLKSP